jgi:hypothetical protein
MNLSTSLTSEEYLLDSATTEYYTQAEMLYEELQREQDGRYVEDPGYCVEAA